jgi:hypothetical protein
LLLHIFEYGSIDEMPTAPIVYIVLSPILIVGTIGCYFYPIHAVSVRDAVLSICKHNRKDGTLQEQKHLMEGKARVDQDE